MTRDDHCARDAIADGVVGAFSESGAGVLGEKFSSLEVMYTILERRAARPVCLTWSGTGSGSGGGRCFETGLLATLLCGVLSACGPESIPASNSNRVAVEAAEGGITLRLIESVDRRAS